MRHCVSFSPTRISTVHQNKAKREKFPGNCVLGVSVKLNIFSTIQLINEKFSKKFDGQIER